MKRSDFDDLAQREIDGLNSTADSARLEAIAAGSPDDGARLSSLRHASEALGRAERLEPPPGFVDDVMRSVRRRVPEARPGWRESFRALFAPVPLAATAVALVLGVVLGGLLGQESGLFSSSEKAALSGTSLSRDRLAGGPTFDRKVIARDGLRGEAVSRAGNGLVVVDVELDAARPVDVSLGLVGTGLSLRSFSRDGGPGADVSMTPAEVRFTHPAGRGRYSLSFAPGGAAGRTLRLRVGEGEAWDLSLGRREAPR